MTGSNNDEERKRHHRERRLRATKEGRHLPTFDELLTGFPPLNENLNEDAQTFAERLLPRITVSVDRHGHVRRALAALTVSPGAAEYMDVVEALEDVERGGLKLSLIELVASARLRCLYYAAAAGDGGAARRIAAKAATRASHWACSEDDVVNYATLALGWLVASNHNFARPDDVKSIRKYGETIVKRLMYFAPPSTPSSASPEPKTDLDQPAVAAPVPAPGDAIVVIREIGNADTSDGKRVAREFEKVTGKALPLVQTTDLQAVRTALMNEYPYAENVIDRILLDIAPSKQIRFRPTVFVGAAGAGKTTFAARLFDALGVKHSIYPCGGVSDSSIAGTARRWSTGEASLPVSLARRWMTASPGIILDELEKTGTSRYNGNLLDTLLTLLEQQSSSVWLDPYIQSEVNLSNVLWLGCANALDGVPGPLRDRCRIIAFPAPQPEHLDVLAAALLPKIVAIQGLDARWGAPLDPQELEALRQHWPGGSIRHLWRLVEAVLGARGHDQRQH